MGDFRQTFAEGAFKFERKTVPLVIYENGKRRVIGEATMIPDGHTLKIEGHVVDPTVVHFLEREVTTELSAFSISQPPPAKPETPNPMTES
jgi:hypothetical protein